MPKYDRVVIIGYFNIHVCCPTKPLVKDFLNLIYSLNLVQSVTGSTQQHGHTLALVLSYGLPVFNIEACDAVFSDHVPVLFETSLSCPTVKPFATVHCCCKFNPFTAVDFLCRPQNCC